MKKYHEIKVRVRYAETDQMGVVYHGNYVEYLEIGRVEWLRSMGISYREMEENGTILPIISLKVDYKKPAKYDDVLTVKTMLSGKPSIKIIFNYEITNEKGDLIAIASTTLAFIDKKSGKPMKCPEIISDKLTD
ncbi:thioesterase family protein [Leptobacterium sp. I13]|uniref:acyl-CoA thioesterase n=1 Tax=Leptobacterium meishanense TaxID=3128904 RepID=UPI0030EEB6C5